MKTKQLLTLLATLLLLMGAIAPGWAQQQEKDKYKPFKLKLNEDGSKFLHLNFWHQLWLTTNNLEADDAKLQLTPSIRRSRISALAQISPRFLLFTHFGLNSFNPGNATTLGNNGDSPQLFLHGAWGEVKILNELYIGTGLHYWKGLTRISSQSTLNFMTLDQSRPFIAWHSLGVTDQFARHLGVYIKGAIENFDYRMAVNSPNRNTFGDGRNFGNGNANPTALTYTGVSNANTVGDLTGNTIIEGYFRYNFWDKEGTKRPFNVGTYLGKKKVLAFGAGFFAHPNGMFNTETGEHAGIFHFAVDAFLDIPIGTKGGALNAYATFINFDYGENYVSRWGGTGTAIFGQLGYLIPTSKFMPYVALQSANYEGYEDPVSALDIGCNYFINGHHAKVTLEYHRIAGDVREEAIATQDDALSQLRLQLHIFL